MPQKALKLCDCKQCRVARRSGKVLGTRTMYPGAWVYGEPVRDSYRVSDYVSHPKFAKGRRPDIVED